MLLLSDLTRHSYSNSELSRCLRGEDFRKFKLKKATLAAGLATISDDFYTSRCGIKDIRKVEVGGRSIFHLATLYDSLCLRRTDKILRHGLRTNLLHRNQEIRQLLNILRTEKAPRILRTDISSFFESVPLKEIISELEAEGLRHNSVLLHLQNLHSYLVSNFGHTGLPRGLGISSTLSDYVMKRVDQHMMNCDGVIYYSRYVDDICVVHHATPHVILAELRSQLRYGLALNTAKTRQWPDVTHPRMDYLGYDIDLSDPSIVRIAKRKIEKAKLRIALSLKAFLADRDFPLLRARLCFLANSTRMKISGRKQHVFVGFRYTYLHCDEKNLLHQLGELDRFMQGLLRSKRYSLTAALHALLTQPQLVEISTISFVKGYTLKLTTKTGRKRIAKIVAAWQYA
jgi:hypothetical protein